jgi:hypothetical protein
MPSSYDRLIKSRRAIFRNPTAVLSIALKSPLLVRMHPEVRRDLAPDSPTDLSTSTIGSGRDLFPSVICRASRAAL